MSEFYLCQIALIGARMSSFQPYGFHSRNELAMRRLAPQFEGDLTQLDTAQIHALFTAELPVWLHNIVTDLNFPLRDQFVMPLRRFEGELSDNKNNDVVAAVLSAGFRNETLDPLDLPQSMPLRQRCAMVAHLDQWQDAYLALVQELIEVFMTDLSAIEAWLVMAKQPDNKTIAYSESA